MKAITITQPWATLIALGHKRIETRSWVTNYRGPIAIHAAKGFPVSARRFAEIERSIGRVPASLPCGAVVATARLVDVRPTWEVVAIISGLERHLGNYSAGRFAFVLEEVVVFTEPVPVRGALGLWEWTP